MLRRLAAPAARLLPESVRLAVRARRAVRGGERELPLVPALSRAGSVAVDVGANLGVYAFHMRRAARHLVAVEPVPALAARLERAFGARATVLGCALSDREGEAELAIPRLAGGDLPSRATLEPGVNREFELTTVRVRLRTLDGLGLGDVGFLKVHTEGHEPAVVRGGLATLARCRPAVLVGAEERHRPGGREEIAAMLRPLGYEGWFVHRGALLPMSAFDPSLHQDPARAKRPGAVHGDDYVHNFLFVHVSRPETVDRVAARLPGGRQAASAAVGSPRSRSIAATSPT